MDANTIIDAFGGTVATAAVCKTTKSAVSQWRKNGIPDARLQLLELLRPDIFQASTKNQQQG